MIRRLVAVAVLALLVSPLSLGAAGTKHRYITGIAGSFGTFTNKIPTEYGTENETEVKTFTVSGGMYVIGDPCPVWIREERGGAFHNRPAKLRDLRSGERVVVKVLARTIQEITIERWQQ